MTSPLRVTCGVTTREATEARSRPKRRQVAVIMPLGRAVRERQKETGIVAGASRDGRRRNRKVWGRVALSTFPRACSRVEVQQEGVVPLDSRGRSLGEATPTAPCRAWRQSREVRVSRSYRHVLNLLILNLARGGIKNQVIGVKGHSEGLCLMARVLLVEDEISVLILAESVLQGLGHSTLSAASSAEALVLLEDGNVDLLFTDIRLPEGDLGGFDLAKTARENNPNLKVLYTTGAALTDGMKAMIVDGGVMLLKPYTAPELAQMVKRVLA